MCEVLRQELRSRGADSDLQGLPASTPLLHVELVTSGA